MLISVIIPVYNSDYIEKQLFSIKNINNNTQLEIIIIDDWSNIQYRNKYTKILNSFTDLHIKYHYLWEKNWENRVCKARNKWVEISTSENLYFIDQETILSKNTMEGLLNNYQYSNMAILWPYFGYNNLKKNILDEDIFFFIENWYIDKDNYEDFRICFYKEKEENGRLWEFFGASNFFIRKSIFVEIWWFDESITTWWDEDTEFWYRLFKSWCQIIFDINMGVLNLSKKLYNTPYSILEDSKVESLSENWYKNYQKHKSYDYKRYIFDRFNYLELSHKKKISKNFSRGILNHAFYEHEEKFIFFRIDDVRDLSDNFVKLLSIFTKYGHKIVLWIEPANIESSVIAYLNLIIQNNPNVDLVQHGFSHKNKSSSKYKYEFWENIDYNDQFNSIASWYTFMQENFWSSFLRAFIPPFNNYDKNTEIALWNLWFSILSSWYPTFWYFSDKEIIQLHSFLDIVKNYSNVKYKNFNEIIGELLYYISRDWFVGITLHPQFMNKDSFILLIQILEYIKMKEMAVLNFSTFLMKYWYGK